MNTCYKPTSVPSALQFRKNLENNDLIIACQKNVFKLKPDRPEKFQFGKMQILPVTIYTRGTEHKRKQSGNSAYY